MFRQSCGTDGRVNRISTLSLLLHQINCTRRWSLQSDHFVNCSGWSMTICPFSCEALNNHAISVLKLWQLFTTAAWFTIINCQNFNLFRTFWRDDTIWIIARNRRCKRTIRFVHCCFWKFNWKVQHFALCSYVLGKTFWPKVWHCMQEAGNVSKKGLHVELRIEQNNVSNHTDKINATNEIKLCKINTHYTFHEKWNINLNYPFNLPSSDIF